MTITRVSLLPETHVAGSNNVALRTLPFRHRYSLRIAPEATARIERAGRFLLALEINRMAQLNGAMSARLGPDEWLLATGATELDPRAEITAGLVGTFHALVDIGHRNVGIEVAGRHAPEVLNGGCPLDLADHVFSPGTATRTIFGKAEIVLFRQGPERSYHIECWRSFAPYVRDLLMDTAREFR